MKSKLLALILLSSGLYNNEIQANNCVMVQSSEMVKFQDSSTVMPPTLPKLENKKVLKSLEEYKGCLDKYYTNIINNRPDAIQLMMNELTPISNKILDVAQDLEIMEMESITDYLTDYDLYIQHQVNEYYRTELKQLEEKIKENEAKRLEMENE